jgi:hypothetical protein
VSNVETSVFTSQNKVQETATGASVLATQNIAKQDKPFQEAELCEKLYVRCK